VTTYMADAYLARSPADEVETRLVAKKREETRR
jgi:hypothetical protein